MTFDPTAKQIADALRSPLANVEANWPIIRAKLQEHGITYDSGLIAALATIGAEARTFAPIREYGNTKYFFHNYDPESPFPDRRKVAETLGNNQPGDGARFCGRGFVQTTGRANYRELTRLVGIDLEEHPEELEKPLPAAIALAHYFRSRGCDVWAQKAFTSKLKTCQFCPGNGLLCTINNGVKKCRRPRLEENVCSKCGWKMVRRLVNGGLNGWVHFEDNVQKLLKLVK